MSKENYTLIKDKSKKDIFEIADRLLVDEDGLVQG